MRTIVPCLAKKEKHMSKISLAKKCYSFNRKNISSLGKKCYIVLREKTFHVHKTVLSSAEMVS